MIIILFISKKMSDKSDGADEEDGGGEIVLPPET